MIYITNRNYNNYLTNKLLKIENEYIDIDINDVNDIDIELINCRINNLIINKINNLTIKDCKIKKIIFNKSINIVNINNTIIDDFTIIGNSIYELIIFNEIIISDCEINTLLFKNMKCMDIEISETIIEKFDIHICQLDLTLVIDNIKNCTLLSRNTDINIIFSNCLMNILTKDLKYNFKNNKEIFTKDKEYYIKMLNYNYDIKMKC